MRKRQVNNMHGGYRGSGVTLDWHTTYPNKIPDPPSIPVNIPPPILINTLPPSNNSNIVGYSLFGAASAALIGTAAYYEYKNRRLIGNENNRIRNLLLDENDTPESRRFDRRREQQRRNDVLERQEEEFNRVFY